MKDDVSARCLSFTVYRSLFTVDALSFAFVWTGGRVAEGVGLENRYTRKGIVGSNPTLSVLVLISKSPHHWLRNRCPVLR